MWDLIVSVPDHCLSFYFTICPGSGIFKTCTDNVIFCDERKTYCSEAISPECFEYSCKTDCFYSTIAIKHDLRLGVSIPPSGPSSC